MFNRETIQTFLLEKGIEEILARNLSTYVEAVLTNTGYTAAAVRSQTVNADGTEYSAELKGGDNRDISVKYECIKRTAGLYEHVLAVKSGDNGFTTGTLESRPLEDKSVLGVVSSLLLPEKEEEVPAEEPADVELVIKSEILQAVVDEIDAQIVADIVALSDKTETPNEVTERAIADSWTDEVESAESVEALVEEAAAEEVPAAAAPEKKAAAKKAPAKKKAK